MLYVYRNQIESTSDLLPSVRRRSIEPGAWAQSAGRLLVRNVGHELVLAAHNVISAQGVLACFTVLSEQGERTMGELFDAVRNLGPRHATDVWVGGMRCHGSAQPYSVDTARALSFGRVSRIVPEGGTLRTPEWNNMLSGMLSVELNSLTAVLTVQETAV